uniref:Uncharacterized protein n=1 Tax=Romanomermis culicivorax TaxID=13658 RepID=A0A915ISS1_ROMCU
MQQREEQQISKMLVAKFFLLFSLFFGAAVVEAAPRVNLVGRPEVECRRLSCYPACCRVVPKAVDEDSSNSKLLYYLLKQRQTRSLDMIDAPTFGSSTGNFGDFGGFDNYRFGELKRTGNGHNSMNL